MLVKEPNYTNLIKDDFNSWNFVLEVNIEKNFVNNKYWKQFLQYASKLKDCKLEVIFNDLKDSDYTLLRYPAHDYIDVSATSTQDRTIIVNQLKILEENLKDNVNIALWYNIDLMEI